MTEYSDQKIIIINLKNIITKLQLIYIYLILNQKICNSYFLQVNESFAKVSHMLSHKANLNKFQKIKSIHPIFSTSGIKLETSNQKMTKENPKCSEIM